LNSLKKEQMEGLFGAEHPLPPSEGPGGGGGLFRLKVQRIKKNLTIRWMNDKALRFRGRVNVNLIIF
jgi:hypothetical protein